MNWQYIEGLIKYYNYIDFNTLSKVKIDETATTNDLKMIFLVSNIIHLVREKNYAITKEELNYINKIKNN
jgi:hypothetical protein